MSFKQKDGSQYQIVYNVAYNEYNTLGYALMSKQSPTELHDACTEVHLYFLYCTTAIC